MTREEAIAVLESDAEYMYSQDTPYNREAYQMAVEALRAESTKHGRWEQYLDEGLKWKCSKCGSRFATPWHYCPNCSARMDEVEE